MRNSFIVGVAAAVATAFLPPAAAAQSGTYTLPGDRVAIYNLVGTVSVQAGTGPAVTVEVAAAGADAGRLRVETGTVDRMEALRVIYPGDRIVVEGGGWSGNTQLQVREDGSFGDGWDGRRGGRRVTISSRGDGLRASANLVIRVPAGKRVSVNLGAGRMESAGVTGDLDLDAASADITVRGHTGQLGLDTGSGDVSVTNVEGDLNVDTGSGAVSLADIRADDLSIDTGSGDVTGRGLRAADLNVDTGSGTIELSGVEASVIGLDTGSGDIRLALAGGVTELDVDTGSGAVVLTVQDGFSAALRIETSSGDIETEVPVQVTRRGRGELVGIIGSGGGRVTIETGSGDVTIRQ